VGLIWGRIWKAFLHGPLWNFCKDGLPLRHSWSRLSHLFDFEDSEPTLSLCIYVYTHTHIYIFFSIRFLLLDLRVHTVAGNLCSLFSLCVLCSPPSDCVKILQALNGWW
jgi:hypothetical protein